MRLAVTGKAGQVACALAELAPGLGHELVKLGRPQLDLADPATIGRAIRAAQPDAVISAAAYTAVDKAEGERDIAFAVNGTGAGAVAAAAWELGLPVIHLSTDYVFDGRKAAPYTEDDPVAPLGAYGASKLAGEQAVMMAHARAVILRTAWVYSPFGANFVKTMLRLAATRDEIGVVGDQRGNPTSALDIAAAVMTMAVRLAEGPSALAGIFHLTGSGEASWADFAEAIFAASACRGGPSARVRRITTADYPTPAPRPANSRLDCAKLAAAYGLILPDWHSSVEAVVARLVSP